MTRGTTIGIDLGATSIKAARVDAWGRIAGRARRATGGQEGAPAVLERVAQLVSRLRRGGALRGVGVGACGFIDAGRGRVIEETETFPGWGGTEVVAELTHRTGLACVCDNDGNAAALGEALHGAGRGHPTVAVLTLGTGVGGGFVRDGEIVRGAGGMAGTFGHMKVRRGGRRCACGGRGCLEAYASDWAFRRTFGANGKDTLAAARGGDREAARLVASAADALGSAFAEVAHALNPDVVVIGGGLAKGWRMLRPQAMARYEQQALRPAFASTKIVRGRLGDDAGVIGAAALLR